MQVLHLKLDWVSIIINTILWLAIIMFSILTSPGGTSESILNALLWIWFLLVFTLPFFGIIYTINFIINNKTMPLVSSYIALGINIIFY